jgi:ubiquinone/menaquinone biosynthesis C-methylase UbiE
MMTQPQDAWSLYWSAGNVESCTAAASDDEGGEGGENPLHQVWASLARELPQGAQVLDLATGNGAVPVVMARANPSLRITGVDRADIDPAGTVASVPELEGIRFHSRVDAASLPFESASFDVVTSQYGVEYAELGEAIGGALGVLRPGGSLHCVLHHADSAVVAPAGPLRDEITSLLAPDGPVSTLTAYVAGKASVEALERSGERHLSASIRRTRRITGQIYRMVNVIVEHAAKDPEEARIMAGVMGARLAAESERLRQMVDAALDFAAAERLQALLRAQQAEVIEMAPLYVPAASTGEDVLVGWRLHARRASAE